MIWIVVDATHAGITSRAKRVAISFGQVLVRGLGRSQHAGWKDKHVKQD
jgi:hypothetical protein